jgi:uncharacterized protein
VTGRARSHAADVRVVAGQLGRRPHPFGRVVARCPFGYPAAVEDLPYDERGAPFPTLFYLTCPTFVAGVSRLESEGGVRRWTERVVADPLLRRSLTAAAADTRRRRRLLVSRTSGPVRDAGASLSTGVAGVRDPQAIKCLHAHVAHFLAHRAYAFGRAVATEVERPWCDDRRCAEFTAAAGPSALPAQAREPAP